MDTPHLSNKTHIFFITGESSNLRIYYLVSNNGTYGNAEIIPYSSISFSYNNSKAIYFASRTVGTLEQPPKFNKETYTGIIVLYDDGRNYSQSFPLLGIKVI
jgi:hypothetical protein